MSTPNEIHVQCEIDYTIECEIPTTSNKLGIIQLRQLSASPEHFEDTAWLIDSKSPCDNRFLLKKLLLSGDFNSKGADESNSTTQITQSHFNKTAYCNAKGVSSLSVTLGHNQTLKGKNSNSVIIANYILEYSGNFGLIHNKGILWGYSIHPANNFNAPLILEPTVSVLSQQDPHTKAISHFLQEDIHLLPECNRNTFLNHSYIIN